MKCSTRSTLKLWKNIELNIVTATLSDLNQVRELEKLCFDKDAWPLIELVAVLILPGLVRLKVDMDGRMAGFIGGDRAPNGGDRLDHNRWRKTRVSPFGNCDCFDQSLRRSHADSGSEIVSPTFQFWSATSLCRDGLSPRRRVGEILRRW